MTSKRQMPPPGYAEHAQSVVAMANANNAEMGGTMRPVMEICDSADIVYGVYQDPSKAFGVGIRVVKGENLLREVVSSNTARECSTTAIKCVDAEQAEALRQMIGDPLH